MGKSFCQAIEVDQQYGDEKQAVIIATMLDGRTRWYQRLEQLDLGTLKSLRDLIDDYLGGVNNGTII